MGGHRHFPACQDTYAKVALSQTVLTVVMYLWSYSYTLLYSSYLYTYLSNLFSISMYHEFVIRYVFYHMNKLAYRIPYGPVYRIARIFLIGTPIWKWEAFGIECADFIWWTHLIFKNYYFFIDICSCPRTHQLSEVPPELVDVGNRGWQHHRRPPQPLRLQEIIRAPGRMRHFKWVHVFLDTRPGLNWSHGGLSWQLADGSIFLAVTLLGRYTIIFVLSFYVCK